jgi:hypothetical protein
VSRRRGLQRGLGSGLLTIAVLGLALLPSRLSVAMRVRGGSTFERLTRAFAGTVVDLSALVAPLCAGLALVTCALLLAPRLRGPWWQRHGAPLLSLPVGFAVAVLALIEQEVKAERGAFPTMAELLRSGGNASFVEGSLGFVRYERMWVPSVTCLAATALLLTWSLRRAPAFVSAPRGPWVAGLVGAFGLGALALPGLVSLQAQLWPRLGPGGLSAPMAALVESSADLLLGREPGKPAELMRQLKFSSTDVAQGAARLGWPATKGATCHPHPHARELEGEPTVRATPLLHALEQLSRVLFADVGPDVALFQFSLESFRADDLHALHDAAPVELDPFVNELYRRAHTGEGGVLASAKTFQAGVRTAQGLAAMTCGLGTLPWNLALIRDVDAFPMRCAPDLFAEAGFHGAFLYGSDASYDGMAAFARAHGLGEVLSQDELPADLPKGAWAGLTDLAVFSQAAQHVATALEQTHAPQLAMVMSLSNHSPYTLPEDLPAELNAQVDAALAHAQHRATGDDRRRLLTHAYTDLALRRFFERLNELGISDRSVVVFAADHSTGEDYVWGAPGTDHETDAAKAQVPFVIVLPDALRARVKDQAGLDATLRAVQAQLDQVVLSQNDVPTLLLALLSAHPGLRALAPAQRWHTLGGQATSPWFQAGGGEALLGINGVDELYTLDERGERAGPYEDAVFLQTLGDATRVTPRLIPVAATLVETLDARVTCQP